MKPAPIVKPKAHHDSDNLPLFSDNERIPVYVGAFVITFFIHFWFRDFVAGLIQSLSDYVFTGPKIELLMRELEWRLSLSVPVSIPSS